MTDREPMIPADLTRPINFRPQIDLLFGDLSPNVFDEPAQRGDLLPMPLTLTPRPSVRTEATGDMPEGTLRSWLSQIESSNANLAPFAPITLPGSHSRNALDAEAAARAAGCPDLFAIHSPEQTSRERIIADIAWASDFERVLILSPDANTADRIVERLVKVDVPVVRVLADDENPARPSPIVTRSTSSSLALIQLERLQSELATNLACASDRLNDIDRKLTSQAEARMLTSRCAELDAEIAAVKLQCECIERQVQLEAYGTESTVFTELFNQRKIEQQVAVDGISQKRLTTLEIHKGKEAQLADLRRHAHETANGVAKKSGFFSRLLGRTKPNSQPLELDKQLRDAERELNEIAETTATLQQDFQQATARLEEEREKLIRTEISVRRSELDSRLSRLTNESDRLRFELEATIRAFESSSLNPTELAAARNVAERELSLAHQRAAEQQITARDLEKRIFAELRVVVGTPGSLLSNQIFERDPHDLPSQPPFGLLVLDRAEELTEHDFIRLARLATRWVLVGDVAVSEESPPQVRGSPSRNGLGPGRNGRAFEIPFAARLARVLDRERWTHENDRLVCRLVHLSPDDWRKIVREPLLDSPDIELRFLTNTEGEPVLVEVAFPPATSIGVAKSFLYRQLGEVLLRPCGDVAWHSTAEQISLTWPTVDRTSKVAEAVWIDLEPGVREKVIGVGIAAFTAAITFDIALGWNAENAEKWLQEHLETGSTSRFASVTKR